MRCLVVAFVTVNTFNFLFFFFFTNFGDVYASDTSVSGTQIA